MSNFGIALFFLSVVVFAIVLFHGVPLMTGHIALAILCACQFGMGIGLVAALND